MLIWGSKSAKPVRDMPRSITPLQQKTLDAVRQFITDHGCGPTIGELCAALGMPSGTAPASYLKGLRALGLVAWNAGDYKSLHLTGDTEPTGAPLDDLDEDVEVSPVSPRQTIPAPPPKVAAPRPSSTRSDAIGALKAHRATVARELDALDKALALLS